MIICGVSDNVLRERMLRESNLTLKKTIELGLAAEETRIHSKQLSGNDATVDKINRRDLHSSSSSSKSRETHENDQRSYFNRKEDKRGEMFNNCKFCGGSHVRGNCPAYNKICNKCSKKGHFARCCMRKVNKVNKIKEVKYEDTSSDDNLCISTIEVDYDSLYPDNDEINDINLIDSKDTSSEWTVYLLSNNRWVSYKLDTGAQVNVLPERIWKKLHHRPQLKE